MQDIYSDLRTLVLTHGVKGISLLILLNYGFFTLALNLLSLVIDTGSPVFGGPWGVLLFSCAMTSISLKWPAMKPPA